MSEYIEIRGSIPYEKILQEITTANYCIFPQPNRLKRNVSSSLKSFEYRASSKSIIFTPKPTHKKILSDQDFVVWSKEDQIENYVDAIIRTFDNRGFLATDARIALDIVKTNYDWLCHRRLS